MDLSFSEEQTLLRDTAARVSRDHGGVERRRALRASTPGFSPETWAAFAELGWLALPFAEQDGGLGGQWQDVAILAEQIGRELVPSPYLDTVVVCGALLGRGSEAQRERHLPPLIAGQTQWSLACAEAEGSFVLADVTTSARSEGEGWLLDGSKFAAPNAHAADAIILSARTGTAGGDDDLVRRMRVRRGELAALDHPAIGPAACRTRHVTKIDAGLGLDAGE